VTAKEKADKLLDDMAFLHYGVKYEALEPEKQDAVFCEVIDSFDPRMVDLADAMGGDPWRP
jgi:hypothetical protein